MIQHIVLFKWKAGAQKSEVDRAETQIKSLAGIDGVTEFVATPNLQNGSDAYNFILSVRLPSIEFLEKTYRPHPLHTRLYAIMDQVLESVISVDAAV